MAIEINYAHNCLFQSNKDLQDLEKRGNEVQD